MMEWISVEDELPEEGSVVLVWDESQRGDTRHAHVHRFNVRTDNEHRPIWFDDYLYDVTHWMPLPAAPKT